MHVAAVDEHEDNARIVHQQVVACAGKKKSKSSSQLPKVIKPSAPNVSLSVDASAMDRNGRGILYCIDLLWCMLNTVKLTVASIFEAVSSCNTGFDLNNAA